MNQEKKEFFNTPEIESETIETLSAKLLAVTKELSAANAKLLAVQKEREEMLANISHDLRAPVTAIRSALDYLNAAKDLPAEEYHSTVALIDRRTKVLEELINDMYYLFCVEDTGRPLNLTTIQLAPFLEEYYYDLFADSRFDSHAMDLQLADSINDLKVNIDIQKFVRVLDNLFTNAHKYTQEDSEITLSAEAVYGDSGADAVNDALKDEICSSEVRAVRIIVSDNGPGIAADALPLIFGRSYTVSSARTPDGSVGSGLGLSIVKAILERHGGSAACESEEGHGCRFILELPIVQA